LAEMPVNSAHHQAVKDVAPGLVVDALAPDGVIEGIEDPKRRFVLGVQWHPEYRLSDGDRRIFSGFIQAARG
ncbi:MAG: gamma-glutamyl-gamma-aminobutyrate hydrolase family protein, partial [Stellaceae bacterium]